MANVVVMRVGGESGQVARQEGSTRRRASLIEPNRPQAANHLTTILTIRFSKQKLDSNQLQFHAG